jgi:hypothetical protein
MKLTDLDVHEAYTRAIHGESVNSIARSMAVTEGALRWRFRNKTPPREIRRVAWLLYEAEQAMGRLASTMGGMTPALRAKVERLSRAIQAEATPKDSTRVQPM